MKFRNLAAVDRFLEARSLPTFHFFNRVMIGYYLAFLILTTVVDLNYPDEFTQDYAFFQHSIAQGRFIPISCFLLVFTYCGVRKPGFCEKKVANACMILSGVVYLIKCFWLGVYLSEEPNNYSPTAILHFLEAILYMYMGTLAVIIARQKEFTKLQWMRFDLVFMLMAVLGLFGTLLRGFGILSRESAALGIVIAAIALGHKFAKYTCSYWSEVAKTRKNGA